MKKEKESKTYRAKVYCINCDEFGVVDVPKGTLLEDFLNNKKNNFCESCGCSKTLHKDML